MQPGRARTSGLGVPLLPLARWVGWVGPVRPTHGVLVLSCPSAALRVCSVLGRLAPVHRCARAVCCVASAVSWATWLLFTVVLARCVVLRVRCPGPLGSRSPVRPLGVLWCVCGVLGHLAPVQRCARSVCCFACAVSWATWLLFTGVPAGCVVFGVRCPGPLGSCSPVCPLGVLFCVCGVLGHLAPVHQCARSVCCVACAVSWATWLLFSSAPAGCVVVCELSWATWLLFTDAPARCVALRVRCPGPLGFLFTGVPAPWVVLRVRCPRPLGSYSPVCPLGVLCCACDVLGHLAPVHRCARSVRCVVCAFSWATWLLFTCAPARCVASRVRCPGPLGSCSPVCPLRVLFCVCGVLGLVALVHRCVRSVCCVVRLRCPGPLGSCSPVRPLRPLLCSCGVLGHLAPVHRCARSLCCFACAVSWATWLLFTGVPGRCVVLRVRCPGPLGCCSPVRPLRPFLCLCGGLRHLGPVHRCARSVCCFAFALSWATWLLFTGLLARCVVLCVRCPGPLGSCSPVRPLAGLCCVYGVLGHLTLVHRCACSVCCALGCSCGVAWAGRRCGALTRSCVPKIQTTTQVKEVEVSKLDLLRLDTQQISWYHGFPTEYRKYAAVFEQDTRLYWLHHDLVSNGVVQLCNSCHRSLFHPKKGQVPPNAIASGKHFGKRCDLPELTDLEERMLGRVRTTVNTVKLVAAKNGATSQWGVRGHVVSVPHDEPE